MTSVLSAAQLEARERTHGVGSTQALQARALHSALQLERRSNRIESEIFNRVARHQLSYHAVVVLTRKVLELCPLLVQAKAQVLADQRAVSDASARDDSLASHIAPQSRYSHEPRERSRSRDRS